MRSHGATGFPDPTIGSNGLPSWSINPNVNTQAPAYHAARLACEKDLPHLAPQTPAAKATANAAALKYATCMRANGVPDFPDPNGSGLIQADADSPRFQQAQTACSSLDHGFEEQVSATSASHAPSGSGSGPSVPDTGG